MLNQLCVLSRFSHVQLFATMDRSPPGSLSMGFSRQEYWSGLPFPPPGDPPNPEIEPMSLKSLSLAGGFFTSNATWEACLTDWPCFLFLIEAQLIYNVVFISAVQQSDSVIHIHTSFLVSVLCSEL